MSAIAKVRRITYSFLALVLFFGLAPNPAFGAEGISSVESTMGTASDSSETMDTGDAVAADDLLSTVEELAAGDGEIVDIGFDPMFPDEGYTITTRPASEEESATIASGGDAPIASLSVSSATFEDTLLAGWDTLAERIDVSSFGYEIAEDQSFAQLFEDYVDVILAHPDRFNVRTYLVVSYVPATRQIMSISPFYLTKTKAKYQEMKSSYELGVSRALACITDSMNDVSKVYALHDWLCDRATYNHDAATGGSEASDAYPKSFTSYGCMVEGLGVCQSYTLALSDLLNRAGVENSPLLVAVMNHAWNMVELDGGWYNIDATWDDSEGERVSSSSATYKPVYSYFLQSNGEFEDGGHYGWTDEETYGYDASQMDASDSGYDKANWMLYAPEGNEMCSAVSSSSSGNLTLITKRTADAMGEGSPVRFYAQAWGGTGDYSYAFDSPQIFDGVDQFTTLIDPLNPMFDKGNEYGYAKRGAFSFEFYASETYQLRMHVLDNRYGAIPKASASSTFNLTLNDEAYPSVASRVNTVAAACKSTLGGNASEYEKALWLHDYLIDNATYDLKYVKAEGVLARGRGNCESYHAAYVRLLNAVGISTGRIASASDSHVWTAANLDGEWCQIDVTWDDVDYKYTPFDLRHLYFGLTDELIGFAHKGHTSAVAGYESDSYANNYLIRSGQLTERVDELADEVEAQLKEGNSAFMVAEKNASYPYWAQAYDGESKSIYNSLLAHELEKRTWDVSLNGSDNVATVKVSYKNESNGDTSSSFAGNYSVSASYEAADGHSHVWGNPRVIVDSTCTKEGCQVKACAVCGAEITEPVALRAHEWSEYSVTKKPTCIAAGQGVSTCSTCGQTRVTTLPATGHTWGSWIRTKAPTTSSAGHDERTCETCGASEVRSVDKLPVGGRWVAESGKWWYSYSAGGYPANCWEKIDGLWYHFDAAGWMQTGWLKDAGAWYYLKPGGSMAIGWQKVGSKWYYLNGSGVMTTGWQKVGGKWYYLNSLGEMQTGWLKLGTDWYYLDGGGVMATGWRKVGSLWYYLNGEGVMCKNCWVGNYYLTSSGAMATNTWIGRYHVNANGVWDKTR